MRSRPAARVLRSATNFLKQPLRNTDIRADRIVNSLSIETSRQRRKNAAVQQSVEFVSCIMGNDQVEVVFEQGLRELPEPSGRGRHQFRSNHIACLSLELFSRRKDGLIARREIRNGF